MDTSLSDNSVLSKENIMGGEFLERVDKFLKERFPKRVKSSEVASHIGINLFKFCKRFKKITGRTFKEYYESQRLLYACKLLKESDLKVCGIGMRLGWDYENRRRFTEWFKKKTGFSPSQYRRGRNGSPDPSLTLIKKR